MISTALITNVVFRITTQITSWIIWCVLFSNHWNLICGIICVYLLLDFINDIISLINLFLILIRDHFITRSINWSLYLLCILVGFINLNNIFVWGNLIFSRLILWYNRILDLILWLIIWILNNSFILILLRRDFIIAIIWVCIFLFNWFIFINSYWNFYICLFLQIWIVGCLLNFIVCITNWSFNNVNIFIILYLFIWCIDINSFRCWILIDIIIL
jgi:hypothetical protein